MIRPLGNRIVIEYIEPIVDLRKSGGIFITDTERSTRNKRYLDAKVIAVGRGCRYLREGMTVVVWEHAGDPYEFDSRKVVMMEELSAEMYRVEQP